jgi:OOP family OmpA-OmpF porin
VRASLLTVCASLAGVLWTAEAAADPLRLHLEGAGEHAVGAWQAKEYGFGVDGRFAAELPIIQPRNFGLELEAGSLWLPETAEPDPNLHFANHGDGTALSIMLGVRYRFPFQDVGGLWIDFNQGYVRSGSANRWGFDADIGYDFRVGDGRWDVGPFVGYTEITAADDLRPADAHILMAGIHVALGTPATPRPVEPALPPPPPPKPPPPPPPAPSDRDHDGILDADDACPDVPGIHTNDPKTNGCPPAGDQVRVVEDRIEYDDVIKFDTDSAHVHHVSWPILEKLAKFINETPDIQEVFITGHADERGTEEHNDVLSAQRAESVRDLLVRFGVDPKRLTTRSYGTRAPKAEGHTESEWQQNRRVEFNITKVRNAQGGSTTITPQGAPQ